MSLCLYFPIQTLRCYFFLATTNTWLKEEYTDEDTIEHYEKWLGYIQMLAVFCSPISGMIIDYSIQYFRDKKVQPF